MEVCLPLTPHRRRFGDGQQGPEAEGGAGVPAPQFSHHRGPLSSSDISISLILILLLIITIIIIINILIIVII